MKLLNTSLLALLLYLYLPSVSSQSQSAAGDTDIPPPLVAANVPDCARPCLTTTAHPYRTANVTSSDNANVNTKAASDAPDASDMLDTPDNSSSITCQEGDDNNVACGGIVRRLCEDDIGYYLGVLECVRGRCTVEEAMETVREAWQGCGAPRRSRKVDLLVPFVVEGPALVCGLARLYSRWVATGRWEWDDFVMMVVMVFYICLEIFGTIAAQKGMGVDIWTVDASDMTITLMFIYIAESFYLAILALTKIAVLCFYLRTFPYQGFRVAAYVVMAWVGLSGVVFVVLQIFQCVPVAFIWEGWRKGPFGPHGCLDVNTLSYTSAAFSIAQDIVVLLLPLPVLVGLHVPLRTKIAIMGMFSLGIFVLITSCVRLWAIYSFGDSPNPTWDYTDAVIWTGLEVAVSIIVTSLPALRVLANRRGVRRAEAARRNEPRSASGSPSSGGGKKGRVGGVVVAVTSGESSGESSGEAGQVSPVVEMSEPRVEVGVP